MRSRSVHNGLKDMSLSQGSSTRVHLHSIEELGDLLRSNPAKVDNKIVGTDTIPMVNVYIKRPGLLFSRKIEATKRLTLKPRQ
ncbi:hypothetical protein G6F42_021295 [Rhizopus arrhizus]|nr:hypothetical protein G6F42_021295 [Rhizopus arrhizus]